MKAKELMIGDLVCDKFVSDEPVQVILINENYVHYRYKKGYISSAIGYMEPIPLTEEILDKNFHDPDEGVVWWPNDEPFFHIECLPLNGTRIIMPYTQYVHQLQHALSLAGIEKGIVL